MLFAYRKMRRSSHPFSLLVFAVSLAMPTLAYAEPWLLFCESKSQCGYKTVFGDVKIEPRTLAYHPTPKVITDEMRASDQIRIEFYPDEKRTGHVGYLNASGKVAIQPVYQKAPGWTFSTGFVHVKENGMVRLINKKGELSPIVAQRIRFVQAESPTFLVQRNDIWEITDFYGTPVNNSKYQSILTSRAENQRILYKQDDKLGVVAFDGTEILPALYDHITFSNMSFAVVERDKKKALYNVVSGAPITDFAYDEIYLPSDGQIENNAVVVVKNSQTSLIDFNGTPLTALKFERLEPFEDQLEAKRYNLNSAFSDGRALYFKDKRAGYIDRTGGVVIPPSKFIGGKIFKDGTAEVILKNGKRAIIDREGSVLLKGHEKFYQDGNYIRFGMKELDDWGLMTRTGRVLIKPKHRYLGSVFQDEYIRFTNHKLKQGLLKFDAKDQKPADNVTEIVPAIFDSVYMENSFIFVKFGEQAHPMQLDGTPIGFSLSDVEAVN